MASRLFVVPIEELQERVCATMKVMDSKPGLYLALNRTQKSLESLLKKRGVSLKKIFFVDCISSVKEREDVLHLSPDKLDKIESAIIGFMNEIEGEKFILIDAISSLLIYNDTNKVVRFIETLISLSAETKTDIIAFAPATKGEDLLSKISLLFDEVKIQ